MATVTARSESIQLAAKACGLCKAQGQALRCSRCQVMYYCSREHQAEHHDQHKGSCNRISKCRTAFANEKRKLDEMPDSFAFEADPFNTSVGYFWGIMETRPYMRVRARLIHDLMDIDSRESVEMQLEHARDMLRLSRGDNVGIRDTVPGQLLQLGMDQECYDFVKWYETTGQEGDYDWGNMSLPFLNVRDADALEPVDYLSDNSWGICNKAGAMLVKVRILLDLKDLQNNPAMSASIAGGHRFRSSILAKDPGVLNRIDHASTIGTLESQVKKLYKAVERANKFFWGAMLQPEEHLHELPAYFSPGDITEVQSMLKYVYPSWIMTPGAMEMVKEMTK
ncbi:hypothetical protein AJ79_01833 [Helicocarpus griseus UAMH5409]|uniref:MYND-type domain-containing protein n=1 Tax=Helicocarpus griseus UAMH5409 TaxID=1447875 RepID=A0A2B7XWZ0_9EURO|nr:hypothetical protein AJ79_01833 [Helicocarpus griseus UAMH5409]